MAKSDKDNSFKYRIIGAITILVLLVILLPIFLHNSEEEKLKEFELIKDTNIERSDDQWTSSIQQMEENEGESDDYQLDELSMDEEIISDIVEEEAEQLDVIEFVEESVIEDIDADIAAMNELLPDTIPAPGSESAQTASENDAESSDESTTDAVVDAQESTPPAAEVDPLEKIIEENTGSTEDFSPDNVAVGWIVQVGTFSESSNAQRMIDKLSSNGFQPQHNVVVSNGMNVTRVWVGPYEKRVFASDAMAKVASVAGIKPFIRSYP